MTYKRLNSFSGIFFKERVPRVIKGPSMHSKDKLRKAKGDHLDRVHSDQMVLKMTGRGGWSFLLEAKSLKTNSKKTIRLNSTRTRWFS
jgi:hypothetical protein